MKKNTERYCPSCGEVITEAVHLMTSTDVGRCRYAANIPIDTDYMDYINRFGGVVPEEDELKQIVFTDASAKDYDYISMKGNHYVYETQTGHKKKISSYACPNCHTNVTNVLTAQNVTHVLLVGQTSAAKTCCTVSGVVMADQTPTDMETTICTEFCSGSFEGRYYMELADQLRDPFHPKAPDSTLPKDEKITRQPLAFFSVKNQNAPKKLICLIDYPGEVVEIGTFDPPDSSVIALLVDGEKSIPEQIGFLFLKAQELKDYASRYVILVTKCDLLDAQAVRNIMLAPFTEQTAFRNFSDLAAARRCLLAERLYQDFPALSQFYQLLRNHLKKRVDVVFCAALGCRTDTQNKLQGKYKPQYMADMLLTFAE